MRITSPLLSTIVEVKGADEALKKMDELNDHLEKAKSLIMEINSMHLELCFEPDEKQEASSS
jgi:predicted RND superfamily exporter protein